MAMQCGQCGKKGEGLRRCTGCLLIRYCSRDCQKLDWPRHRVTCSKSAASAASSAMTSQQKRTLPSEKNGTKANGTGAPVRTEQGGTAGAKRGEAAADPRPASEQPTSNGAKKARRETPASDTPAADPTSNGYSAPSPGHFKADDMVTARSPGGTPERAMTSEGQARRSEGASDKQRGSQPAREQPANQQPAHQQPANQQPPSQQPANQQPASQQPANQQPAERAPSRPYYDEEVGEYDEAVSTSDMQPQSGSEDDDDDDYYNSDDDDDGNQRPTAEDEEGIHRSNNQEKPDRDGYEAEMDYQEPDSFPGEAKPPGHPARGESPPGGTLVEEYEATTVYREPGKEAMGGDREKGAPPRGIKIDVEFAKYGNPAGETLAPTPDYVPMEDDSPVPCKTCKTKTSPSNKCSRCLEVTYCSRECQRLDWIAHKGTCTAIDVLTTRGFRELEDKEFEAREAERLNAGEPTTLTPESPYIVPRVTWPEARSRASRLFPWHRVIDRFANLEMDLVGMPSAPFLPWLGLEGIVAIARLTTPYYHPFRHAWSVQDITGKNLYVIFYHDKFPFPYFRYKQLKRDNFICIQNALIHNFADGTVGFRIDDPSVVRILEPSF